MKPAIRLLAAVAPTQAAAKRAAAFLGRRGRQRVLPFSIDGYLRSRQAPSRIVLCPAGKDPAEDIAFLRDASRRLLWPRPGEVLAEAVEGMLGLEEQGASGGRTPSRKKPPAGADQGAAYFLEGAVTPKRADALAEAGIRRWIAVNPRTVRIGDALFARLDRLGIRWLALEPVEAAGVLVSPELARSRLLWRRLLPRGATIRVREPG